VQPRGSGLWVNADLVRAIRTKSAMALKHGFKTSTDVVWKWRKAFGIGRHATTREQEGDPGRGTTQCRRTESEGVDR